MQVPSTTKVYGTSKHNKMTQEYTSRAVIDKVTPDQCAEYWSPWLDEALEEKRTQQSGGVQRLEVQRGVSTYAGLSFDDILRLNANLPLR